MSLNRSSLEKALSCGCGEPDCNEKAEFLHARCHIESGLNVKYSEGNIELYCKECGSFVCAIEVAE